MFESGLQVVVFGWLLIGTFRSDYEYEYKYDFWAREAWALAVVDTVVAVVSSQQKYFSNFCEYEVVTFCQPRECLVDKQHKMPQSRQNIARQILKLWVNSYWLRAHSGPFGLEE